MNVSQFFALFTCYAWLLIVDHHNFVTSQGGVTADPDHGNFTFHNLRPGAYVGGALISEQRFTDEQRLVMKLFRGYDRHSRPVQKQSDRVTISMGLTITQIFELDEKNQVLITNVWLDQEWYDEYLVWDPADYNGLEIVRAPSSRLWLPDIVLYNNAADYANRLVETRALIAYDGIVYWSLPTKLFSSCKIDVTYFPFDEQSCRMKFGSWTYDGFKVDLVNRTENVDLSNYVANGEWELVSASQKRNVVIYSCCEEPYPDVTFYMSIRRKTLYYVHNVFFPCFVMSTLTLLVFLLPPDSGEKCALGITVMLAFAVFMLTVIEKLPETSESVPLISIYLTVVMSMTSVSIILTVGILNLHHKTARSLEMSPRIRRVLNWVSLWCCIQTEDAYSKDPYSDYEYEQDGDAEAAAFLRRLADGASQFGSGYFSVRQNMASMSEDRQLCASLVKLLDRHREDERTEAIIRDWRRLAQVIDRCMFWVFLVLILFFTLFILVISPTAKIL